MNRAWSRCHRAGILALVNAALLLTACQFRPGGLSPQVPAKATPTPVLVGFSTDKAVLDETELQPVTTPQAYANEPPLRVSFDQSEPPPTSIWRSPLMEVPLMLKPEDHFFFVRPIAADQVNWPLGSYRYGYLFSGLDVVHYGIDIDALQGSPVFAAGPGRVVFAGVGLQNGNNDPDDPYGMAVMIQHDFGYQGKILYTVYGHMDRVDVIQGQRVETGNQLGIVGNTGASTGPHLHFEVRVGGFYSSFQNPELWVAPPQDTGVIAGRILDTGGRPIRLLELQIISTENGKVYPVTTYTGGAISEPRLKENFARGDLPGGKYIVRFTLDEDSYQFELQIVPGTVNFFTYRLGVGFSSGIPTDPMPQAWVDSLMP